MENNSRKRKLTKKGTLEFPEVSPRPIQKQDSWAISEVLVDCDTQSEGEDEPAGHVHSPPQSPKFEPTVVPQKPKPVMPGNPHAPPMVPTGNYQQPAEQKSDLPLSTPSPITPAGSVDIIYTLPSDTTPKMPPTKQARTAGYIPPLEQNQQGLVQNSIQRPTVQAISRPPVQAVPMQQSVQAVPMQQMPMQVVYQQPQQVVYQQPQRVVYQQPQPMMYRQAPVGLQPVFVQQHQPMQGQMAVPNRPIMMQSHLQAPQHMYSRLTASPVSTPSISPKPGNSLSNC